jgi:hypothetical protein
MNTDIDVFTEYELEIQTSKSIPNNYDDQEAATGAARRAAAWALAARRILVL